MRNQIVAVLAIVILFIGFASAYTSRPASTETSTYTTLSTATFTTTITPSQSDNVVNCAVYSYQVLLVVSNNSNGVGATSSRGSGFVTDYTTTTSVSQKAGYSTSTTTTVVDSGGPAWSSTVCTWLPR